MNSLKSAITEWIRALKLAPLWSSLAWEDLLDRYRRTTLGIAWVVLSFALFVAVKVLVFGQMVSGSKVEFGLFVTLGFGLWTYISSMVVEGCAAYMHARPWVLGTAMPYPVYLLQVVFRNCLIFALILCVMALAMVWKPTPWTAAAWTVLPALVVYTWTSIWLAMILAPLCARMHDLYHAIQTGMRLLFFLTPVLWMPGISPTLGRIAELNPITSYIEIVRAPLLYNLVPATNWQIVCWINVAGTVAGIAVYTATRKRIAFWV